MKQKPISCSGVTFGDVNEFIHYLRLMVLFLSADLQYGGMDQGVHNYILHNCLCSSAILHEDDEYIISTISYFKPVSEISFLRKYGVLDRRGQPIPIVHQYDRSLKLLFKYNKSEFSRRLLARYRAMLLSPLKKLFFHLGSRDPNA